MRTALLVYLVAMLLVLPKCAHAFDYEVDMPTSSFGKYHMVRIKINKCDTMFKFEQADFDKYSDGKIKLDTAKMVKIAIERDNQNCPKADPEPIYIQRGN